MRLLILAVPLLFTAALQAEELKVNLDRPGVMEQIQRDNPKRYQAIENILKVSTQLPCTMHELKLLQAQFGVEDLDCGVLLLTSYPAQRGVHFHLDGIEYLATVKVDADAKLEPALDAVETDVTYR